MNGQDIVKTLRAFVQFGFSWEHLRERGYAGPLVPRLQNTIPHSEPEGVSITLWALASLGLSWHEIHVLQLDEIILSALILNLKKMNEQNISNALWGLGTMGISPEEKQQIRLEQIMREPVRSQLTRTPLRNVCDILWAHMLLQFNNPYDDVMAEPLSLLINNEYQSISLMSMREIYWSAIYYKIPLSPYVTTYFETELSKETQPRSSKLHMDYSRRIKSLTHAHFENEYAIVPSVWVDMCFANERVVIEIDGPAHNPQNNALKTRVLENLGYRVLRISYQDNTDEQLCVILEDYGITVKASEKTSVNTRAFKRLCVWPDEQAVRNEDKMLPRKHEFR